MELIYSRTSQINLGKSFIFQLKKRSLLSKFKEQVYVLNKYL